MATQSRLKATDQPPTIACDATQTSQQLIQANLKGESIVAALFKEAFFGPSNLPQSLTQADPSVCGQATSSEISSSPASVEVKSKLRPTIIPNTQASYTTHQLNETASRIKTASTKTAVPPAPRAQGMNDSISEATKQLPTVEVTRSTLPALEPQSMSQRYAASSSLEQQQHASSSPSLNSSLLVSIPALPASSSVLASTSPSSNTLKKPWQLQNLVSDTFSSVKAHQTQRLSYTHHDTPLSPSLVQNATLPPSHHPNNSSSFGCSTHASSRAISPASPYVRNPSETYQAGSSCNSSQRRAAADNLLSASFSDVSNSKEDELAKFKSVVSAALEQVHRYSLATKNPAIVSSAINFIRDQLNEKGMLDARGLHSCSLTSSKQETSSDALFEQDVFVQTAGTHMLEQGQSDRHTSAQGTVAVATKTPRPKRGKRVSTPAAESISSFSKKRRRAKPKLKPVTKQKPKKKVEVRAPFVKCSFSFSRNQNPKQNLSGNPHRSKPVSRSQWFTIARQ